MGASAALGKGQVVGQRCAEAARVWLQVACWFPFARRQALVTGDKAALGAAKLQSNRQEH